MTNIDEPQSTVLHVKTKTFENIKCVSTIVFLDLRPGYERCFFHSCQVPTRRDQLFSKNANNEGRRGRGRGGRGQGRGGRGQGKRIAPTEESDQYGYDDSEMWAEFWKWQYGSEEWHAADQSVGDDKAPKKRKAQPKEKTEIAKKPKSVSKTGEPCKKQKEKKEMVPDKASKALKRAVTEFVKKFDYNTLDLEGMKERIKEELPTFNNISFNCYWTRAACGVRRKQDGSQVEGSSQCLLSFPYLPCGP